MPGGGVSDCQCFDDQQLSAGDAVPGFFFLRLTETETLMAFGLSSVGHRDLLSHFFALQERSMRYISRISSAIQNISRAI